MKNEEIKPNTVVEIIVTFVSLGWALVMLTRSDVFESSANFDRIEMMARKEWIIGLVCLSLAITKIIGMTLHSSRIRRVGLLSSGVFWIVVSAGFLLSNDTIQINTGFIAYSAFSVMCVWTAKEVKSCDRAV